MTKSLASQAGTAFIWKAIQIGGIKVIYLLRTIVLARLLLPEDFGLVALALLAVDFLMNVTNFGMLPALVQYADANDRHYDAAWTINITRAIAVASLVFLAAPSIATLVQEPRVIDLIRVATLRPILEALASIKLAQLTRNLQFRSLAVSRFAEALANTVFSISLAPIIGVWALILGALAGQIAHVITSYIIAPYLPRLHFKAETSRPLIQFGQWVFLTQVISVTASAALQIIISRRLGAAELGTYVLATRLAFLPYELGTEVMSSVAFPMFARLQSDQVRLANAFRSVLTGLLLLLIPACVLLIILAPSLVTEVLGTKWEGTVPIIRVFALSVIVGTFGEVVVPLLNGIGTPRRVAVIEWVQSAFILAAVWFLVGEFGATGAAVATLLAVAVSQVVGLYFLNQAVAQALSGLGPTLMAIVLATVVLSVIAALSLALVPGVLGLIAAGVLSLLGLLGALLFFDNRYNLDLAETLLRTFPQFQPILRRLTFLKVSPYE